MWSIYLLYSQEYNQTTCSGKVHLTSDCSSLLPPLMQPIAQSTSIKETNFCTESRKKKEQKPIRRQSEESPPYNAGVEACWHITRNRAIRTYEGRHNESR